MRFGSKLVSNKAVLSAPNVSGFHAISAFPSLIWNRPIVDRNPKLRGFGKLVKAIKLR
jgi:hypothetical protein